MYYFSIIFTDLGF